MSKPTEDSILPEGLFSKINSLAHVTNDLKPLLVHATELISLTKGSTLFNERDPAHSFYLILSGGIKLTKKSNKTKTLIDILGPGELVGVALMLNPDETTYPVNAQTLGPTDILKYTREDFQTRWTQSPPLLDFAHKAILKRIQSVQNDRCMQRFTLEQKIAYFMTEKWLSSIHLKITRQDIADNIGASQEAVIRLLSDWTKMGLVQNSNQEIKIPDIQKLRALWQAA
ncbi:MAG: Crp/Fnr family transcriptional regulator [Bdellovibrionaceae bacterium]|nr:Crp/Fnr family transcriptional regulator [Pseudobdellovibrionaceae bacterium]